MENLVVCLLVAVVIGIGAEIICRDQKWFNNSRYCLLEDGPMSWKNGLALCSDMGGGLAIPDSMEEQQFIWEMFTDTFPTAESVWIGCTLKGGKWVYPGEGGQVCQYINWAPNQPSQDGVCIHMWRPYAGKLNDVSCGNSYFVTCEIPTGPLVTPRISCKRAHLYVHTPTYCLAGHVIKEFPIKSAIACAWACLGEPRCRSFQLRHQFSPEENICQLNNISHYQAQEDDIELDTNSCDYFSSSV